VSGRIKYLTIYTPPTPTAGGGVTVAVAVAVAVGLGKGVSVLVAVAVIVAVGVSVAVAVAVGGRGVSVAGGEVFVATGASTASVTAGVGFTEHAVRNNRIKTKMNRFRLVW
jgi:hypothetical protein